MFSKKHTSPYILSIILCGIIIRCIVVYTVPKFYAPDELPHFKYIGYIAEHKSLPVSYSKTDASTNDWEYYQPPLYYGVMSVFSVLLQDNTLFYCIRLCSVLLYAITALYVLAFLNKSGFDSTIQIMVQIFFAFLPSYAFISSVINNDNLLNTLAVITIFYTVFPLKRYNNFVIGVLLGFATLTKMSAIVLYVFVFVYYLFHIIKKRKTAGELLTVFLWASVFSVPLLYRNVVLYGLPMGDTAVNIPYHWPNIINATKMILWVLNHSFIGVIGIHNHIYSQMTYFTDIVFVVGIIGYISRIVKEKPTIGKTIRDNFVAYIPYICMVLINLGMVYSAGYLYGQSQGRFLFVSLLPISIFFSYGYSALVKQCNINSWYVISGVGIVFIIHIAYLLYQLISLRP